MLMHRLDNKRQYVFDSDEEKQELINDILSGMYYKEIEVKYDVNEKSIRNLCMRENINVTKLRKKSKEYRTEKAIAMFRENPDPTDDEIREYLAGNLCRCSGYEGQLRGIRAFIEYKKQGGAVCR